MNVGMIWMVLFLINYAGMWLLTLGKFITLDEESDLRYFIDNQEIVSFDLKEILYSLYPNKEVFTGGLFESIYVDDFEICIYHF